MPEIDHHHESESRYSCEKCEDSGVTKDEREYCSCHFGAARKNSDRFAEMLRSVPFTEAIWVATYATMKAERATAAAEKAVLNMQLNSYAKDSYAKDLRIAELERELAEVRKDAQRYRWLRDVGCESFKPYQHSWCRSAAECDVQIDAAMSTPNKGESTLAAKEQA